MSYPTQRSEFDLAVLRHLNYAPDRNAFEKKWLKQQIYTSVEIENRGPKNREPVEQKPDNNTGDQLAEKDEKHHEEEDCPIPEECEDKEKRKVSYVENQKIIQMRAKK